MSINLNIGCGTDYRQGFVNIDGSSEVKCDKQIDIIQESLADHFQENTVDYVLASDILEHNFHWEAVKLLKDIYFILKSKNGILEMRLPDCEYIINSNLPTELKLTLMFGGQDIPQGRDHAMNSSRKKHPEYFCHKYGWTEERLTNELTNIGYVNLRFKRENTNILCRAEKCI
jgi:predicted SAM-dependent methyltransferase